MSTNDGGPAFPHGGNNTECAEEGMSLRDWLAGQALPIAARAYHASRSRDEKRLDVIDLGREDTSDADIIAEYAFNLADAMLEARKAKN